MTAPALALLFVKQIQTNVNPRIMETRERKMKEEQWITQCEAGRSIMSETQQIVKSAECEWSVHVCMSMIIAWTHMHNGWNANKEFLKTIARTGRC